MPGVGAKTWPAVDRTLLSDSDAAVSFLLPYDLGAAGVIIWGPPEDGSRHGLPCPVCEPAANEFWDYTQRSTGPLIANFSRRLQECRPSLVLSSEFTKHMI